MRKVKTNYDDLTQPEFEEFLSHIILCLTGNGNFPALPVPMADIISGKTDWLKQLSLSKQGNHEATTKATNLSNELISKVRKNGNYINDTSDGDVAMLESSGYTLAKEAVYGPRPDVKFSQGEHSGECKVVIEAIPDAVTYLCEIAPDPCPSPDSKEWQRQKLSTKATILIQGLTPRKIYWFRFCYVTATGEKDYSAPVSFSVN